MAKQSNDRLIDVDISRTKLTGVTVYLTEFIGTEGISMPFSFELTLLSETHNIDFTKIIGENVTVSITLADGNVRFFNGIISRFSQGRGGGESGGDPRFSHYRATLVPWLWLASRYTNSRIFQDLSVPEIVEQVFNDRGWLDFENRLDKDYEKRTYCVQYRETDFNFISRLLEEEGIYYFFEYENNKHTLILADAPEKHLPCPNQEEARYQTTGGGWSDEDVIIRLEKMQEIRSQKCTLRDFNFETPGTNLEVNANTKHKLGSGDREIYDYPGIYGTKSEGTRAVDLRMEEEEAKITTILGSSVCRAFTTGYRFKLKSHYRADINEKEYVLTYIDHEASQAQSLPGGEPQGAESESPYRNHFTCIPFDIPFRPPRRAEKPFIRGLQTAMVVGPKGEEIYTDEYGRVKVQFHWDREGKKDDKSSCWIRVGQFWAGNGWGSVFIPRIGDEVIVDFLEGDPDKPIIVGNVYNGDVMPLYPLPGDKTKSTIKTKSSPNDPGFNEFRFEDKKGQEEIFLHAQKDLNETILHNHSTTINVNRNQTVGANKTIAVGANHNETISKNMTVTVGMNETETVAINKAETIGVAKELTIGAVYQVSVGAAMNETIGAAKAEEIGTNKSVSVGKIYSLKTGKKVMIEAEDEIQLKTGQSIINMKKDGTITIKGKTINVKGSGNIVMKGQKILEN
jgi:type VI secretion system secreted protein VgrG